MSLHRADEVTPGESWFARVAVTFKSRDPRVCVQIDLCVLYLTRLRVQRSHLCFVTNLNRTEGEIMKLGTILIGTFSLLLLMVAFAVTPLSSAAFNAMCYIDGSCDEYKAWCKRTNDCLRQYNRDKNNEVYQSCMRNAGPRPEKPANCGSCATPQ